jgi:hypothetical protein
VALTPFQRELCQLLAAQRIASGESYVAGGAALNELLRAPRLSRDLDLFHDTAEAVATTYRNDRATLERAGLAVEVLRERPSFVEAEVRRAGESVLLQWLQESAYRFFPLVREEPFGLALHPFDLATNKVLALVGRVEVRDWVDTLASSDRIQHLGYLAWAACGKDPGFSPRAILEHAARSARYSREEVRTLAFEGAPPDAADLSRRWHALLAEAREIVAALPAEEAGRCVLGADGTPYAGAPSAIHADLETGRLRFHAGCIRGALPTIGPAR